MTPVKTKAKVVTDNTGFVFEMPVLVTEHGVLDPLLDYLLAHAHDRSASWSERVVHATYLLMQYMEANLDCFSDSKLLFESFAQRLYSGTINDEGLDPSSLYWLPSTTSTANGLIVSLTGLTDFLANKLCTQNMNPLRTTSTYEQRLNYAAWYRRNQHDFLGHIKDKTVSETINQARHIRGRRALVTVHDDLIGFPEKLFKRFYREGIGAAKDPRAALRNQLILLMMHFTGCRESDALHLWIDDVLIDPVNPEGVIVRLYHPEDGKAPNDWQGHNGVTNRAAYLRERYALTPRNKLTGTQRVGWKYRIVDHAADRFIQLYWFPSQVGVLFGKLWRTYVRYVAAIDRNHPYAFISFNKENLGQPFTLNALNDAYKKALYRIGEVPAKVEGRSPHAHRHALGRRLEKARVHPRIIQKVLHHKSLTSQEPYTALGLDGVTQALNQATLALEHQAETGNVTLPLADWDELISHGFKDIDPDELLSGPYPKLKGRR
ncbi:MAG: site-specific integrase [Candidatus Thiodiazotropha sp. (ex Lucinoma borealis)]|nr:site-specific integrase [Candidatus Thiodiazotropha sp. (ex Lucinoma borealis)]